MSNLDVLRNLGAIAEELKNMGNSEMWRAGITVRSLRPKNTK